MERKYLKEYLENYTPFYKYPILKKTLTMGREAALEEIKKSKLVGRGGAGFPTYKKLEFALQKKDVILIANADEGEPGTFKDRYIMETNPHILLEGLLIMGYIINASDIYLYVRGEYKNQIDLLDQTIKTIRPIINGMEKKFGFIFNFHVVKGAGAYVCGDETSLINSIEGIRPNSRIKPPFPTDKGLYGRPTVVNNVETISNIPLIIRDGGNVYNKIGNGKSTGTKLFSVSGKVKKPGIYEVELGSHTLKELIYDLAGGIKDNKKLSFVVPGGISTCILQEKDLDTHLDYESMKKIGTNLGSGAVIVADESVDIVKVAMEVSEFFMHETCGICFPCKEGSRQIHHLLTKINNHEGEEKYLDLIKEISETTRSAARCGLGQTSGSFVNCAINKFRYQFIRKIEGGHLND